MTVTIPQDALDALIEIEAEASAKKHGVTLGYARQLVRELWDDGELEVRSVGHNKYVLCPLGGKATWLYPVR